MKIFYLLNVTDYAMIRNWDKFIVVVIIQIYNKSVNNKMNVKNY